MPSGYTRALYEGEPITFEQFVLLCAKQFGVVMSMDDTLSVLTQRWVPSDLNGRRAVELANELDFIRGLSEADCGQRAEIEWFALVAADAADRVRRAEIKLRYEWMLQQVTAWDPPEVLFGLQVFMAEHLREMIDSDCTFTARALARPLTGVEWQRGEVAVLETYVAHSLASQEREEDACRRKREVGLALWAALR